MKTPVEVDGRSYAPIVVEASGAFASPFGRAPYACLLWDPRGGHNAKARSSAASALIASEDFVTIANLGRGGIDRFLVLLVGTGPEVHPLDAAVRRHTLASVRHTMKLAVSIVPENGRSFVLLVDGRPLAQLVGARSGGAVPLSLVGDGLPTLPPDDDEARMKDVRIVAVCECGEYGCAHTRCRIRSVGDRVIFDEFDLDASEAGKASRFEFEVANFDAVVREIVARAREERTP